MHDGRLNVSIGTCQIHGLCSVSSMAITIVAQIDFACHFYNSTPTCWLVMVNRPSLRTWNSLNRACRSFLSATTSFDDPGANVVNTISFVRADFCVKRRRLRYVTSLILRRTGADVVSFWCTGICYSASFITFKTWFWRFVWFLHSCFSLLLVTRHWKPFLEFVPLKLDRVTCQNFHKQFKVSASHSKHIPIYWNFIPKSGSWALFLNL